LSAGESVLWFGAAVRADWMVLSAHDRAARYFVFHAHQLLPSGRATKKFVKARLKASVENLTCARKSLKEISIEYRGIEKK
jgi:hypothetical protein